MDYKMSLKSLDYNFKERLKTDINEYTKYVLNTAYSLTYDEECFYLGYDLKEGKVEIKVLFSYPDIIKIAMNLGYAGNEYQEILEKFKDPDYYFPDEQSVYIDEVYESNKEEFEKELIAMNSLKIQSQLDSLINRKDMQETNLNDLKRVKGLVEEIDTLVKKVKDENKGQELNDLEKDLIFTKLDLVSEILNNVIERTKNNDNRQRKILSR